MDIMGLGLVGVRAVVKGFSRWMVIYVHLVKPPSHR